MKIVLNLLSSSKRSQIMAKNPDTYEKAEVLVYTFQKLPTDALMHQVLHQNPTRLGEIPI